MEGSGFTRRQTLDPRLGTLFGVTTRLGSTHFSALVIPIGRSGASPHQVSDRSASSRGRGKATLQGACGIVWQQSGD
jgi:hypothetical protein